MEITIIGLVANIGKVLVVGATSILVNTMIVYHHERKHKKPFSKNGGGRNESKSTSEKFKELRSIHESN